MVQIVATAGCFPPNYYPQEELIAHVRSLWAELPVNFARLESFHRNVKVAGRHLALPIEEYKTLSGFGERNDAWIQAALELGEVTLCTLFDQAGLHPREIDQLAFTTITGIAVPSIDARLMNRIPFSKHLKRIPIFGWGCLGGAAGIARLADYLRGHPKDAAVLLSVEICSLTIQHEDISVANMISSGLFGDGSAGVLMVGKEHPLARPGLPEVVDTLSIFFPQSEHIMGWDVRDSGFKILLSADVAMVAEKFLRSHVEFFLMNHSLAIADIAHWIVHPGGPKVMESIEQGLDLPADALELSKNSLAKVGNISSASVLLVLDETLNRYQPASGTYGLLMAMGPGFSAELVLLKW
jgi:alkylresorcinol/alkylpyrone synthase